MDIDQEIAQAVILEHYRSRAGEGCCDGGGSVTANGENPLCGDQVELSLTVADGVVACAKFGGQGCAVSQAAASIMVGELEGKPVDEARIMVAAYLAALGGADEEAYEEVLGKLFYLLVLRENTARVRCASIAGELSASLLSP